MLSGAIESIIEVELPHHNANFEIVDKTKRKIDLSTL
jgi:hypothetical protein